MKRMLIALCLLLASLALPPEPALADNMFKISNQTGKTIIYLYVAPSGANNWEEDVLSPEVLNIRTLESGFYCEVNLDMADSYDLRAEFRDGSMHEYYDIAVRKNRGVTLYPNEARYE